MVLNDKVIEGFYLGPNKNMIVGPYSAVFYLATPSGLVSCVCDLVVGYTLLKGAPYGHFVRITPEDEVPGRKLRKYIIEYDTARFIFAPQPKRKKTQLRAKKKTRKV